MGELQGEGKRFEGYQYIALGAGSILAVASGVLFYFGYLAEDTSSPPFRSEAGNKCA